MLGGSAMKKLLLGLSLVLLLLAVLGATAVAQAATLLSDDFESGGHWNSNSAHWTISTNYAVSGTHSAHAPSQSSPTPAIYYGPFDLSGATAATLSFQLWYYPPRLLYPPGSPTTCGAFCVGYSLDGSFYTWPMQWSGDTWLAWIAMGVDLNSASFPLVGHSGVYIALMTTQSQPTATYSEGAYVDDLTLTATVPDAAPPTTTATGAVNGRWYDSAVTVDFTAADNVGGSGVAYTEYSLDGGAWTQAGGVPPVSTQGPHTILYRSVDNNLPSPNVEAAKSLTFGIDTVQPTTTAPTAATARRGYAAALKYRVVDPTPNGGTATVTIKVKNKAGKVVKTLRPVVKPVNTALTWKFTVPRTWRAGTYHFYVYATDRAGNTQATPVGANHLKVK
jgi:hypothetical protein